MNSERTTRNVAIRFVVFGFLMAIANIVPYLLTHDAYATDGHEIAGFPFRCYEFGGASGVWTFAPWAMVANMAIAILVAAFGSLLFRDGLTPWPWERFTVTQMLLAVTWLGIALATLPKLWQTLPYNGLFDDTQPVVFDDLATKRHVTITDEMIASSPAWNPSTNHPPLSARDALRAVDSFRRTHLSESGVWQWELASISLYPLDGAYGKWCWIALFEAYVKSGASSGPPIRYAAYVMMDGNVVGMAETEYWEFDSLNRLGLLRDADEFAPDDLD